MPLLRGLLGRALRRARLAQGRTLREVAAAAKVSMPYLSEVERGRKEASSEVLAAICQALGLGLGDLLDEVRRELSPLETPRVDASIAPPVARPATAPADRTPRIVCRAARPVLLRHGLGRPRPARCAGRPRALGRPVIVDLPARQAARRVRRQAHTRSGTGPVPVLAGASRTWSTKP